MEKVDPIDMLRARAFETELRLLHDRATIVTAEFQEFVDALFAKHGMTKGTDRLESDGTIVRAEAA